MDVEKNLKYMKALEELLASESSEVRVAAEVALVALVRHVHMEYTSFVVTEGEQ